MSLQCNRERLGDYVKIRTGKLDANANHPEGRYPFFTCSEKTLQIDSYSYDCECVLVAGNGDLNVKYYKGKFDAYQRTYVIESLDENTLNARYLYHFMSLYVGQLRRMRIGGVIKYIKLGYLTEAEIPLPPLLEQRRIATILDKADAIRQKRQEALALTDEFLRSAFLEMFGDPVTNPKGWEVAGLADLVGGPVRNGLSPSNRGSYPGQVLTLSAITKGIFQAKKHKEALFDTELPKDKRVDSRDFLICRGNGNIDLVGTGVFPTKSLPDVLFPDTMIGFRINLDNVTRSYLEILWKSRLIRRQIEKGARTTNGTYKINQNILNSISFPLPPIKIQQQFDNIAIHVVRVAKNMSDEIDTTLFDSLTQRAFRGEL